MKPKDIFWTARMILSWNVLSGMANQWSGGSGDINWELRAMWNNGQKNKQKKETSGGFEKANFSNKGDLAALRHDSFSSDQRKIGKMSI